jgi:fructoselysine/glucoselysine PTS system EIIA component
MRKFLIATHGTFAKGLHSSFEMITGAAGNVFLIQAYTDENKSIEDDLTAVLQQINKEDELIIFTDLAGGSVTNQVLQFALRENVYIVSGVNLPLLLDIMLADPDTQINEVIETGISNAKEQIVFINKLLTSKQED